MTVVYAFLNPRPHFLRAFFLFVLGKAVEFSAADEARVARATSRDYLLGAERLEMQYGFLVFERINVHVAARLQLNAEHGCPFSACSQLAFSPPASRGVVGGFALCRVIREQWYFLRRYTLFRDQFAEMIVVHRNRSVTVMRDLRRLVR